MKNKVTERFLRAKVPPGQQGTTIRPPKLDRSKSRKSSEDKSARPRLQSGSSFAVFGDVGKNQEELKGNEQNGQKTHVQNHKSHEKDKEETQINRLRPSESQNQNGVEAVLRKNHIAHHQENGDHNPVDTENNEMQEATAAVHGLQTNETHAETASASLNFLKNHLKQGISDTHDHNEPHHDSEDHKHEGSCMEKGGDLYTLRFDLAFESFSFVFSERKRWAFHRINFMVFLKRDSVFSAHTLRRCVPNPVSRQRLRIPKTLGFILGLCEYIDNRLFKQRKTSVISRFKCSYFLCLLRMKQLNWTSYLGPFIEKILEEHLEEKRKEETGKNKFFKAVSLLNKKLVASLPSNSVKHMHMFLDIERNTIGLQRAFKSLSSNHLKHSFYLIEQMGMKKTRMKKVLKNCYILARQKWIRVKMTCFLTWKYAFPVTDRFLMIMEKRFPNAVNCAIQRVQAKAFHALELISIKNVLKKQITKKFLFDPEEIRRRQRIERSWTRLRQIRSKVFRKSKEKAMSALKERCQHSKLQRTMGLVGFLTKKVKTEKRNALKLIRRSELLVSRSQTMDKASEMDVYTYLDIEEVRFVDEGEYYVESGLRRSGEYREDYEDYEEGSSCDDYEFLGVTEIPSEYFG